MKKKKWTDTSKSGIPLATATVDKLAGLDEETYGRVGYSFNRCVKFQLADQEIGADTDIFVQKRD